MSTSDRYEVMHAFGIGTEYRVDLDLADRRFHVRRLCGPSAVEVLTSLSDGGEDFRQVARFVADTAADEVAAEMGR